MSIITKDHHLSVKPFAAVPAVLDLPEIQCEPASVSNISSRSSMRGNVDLEEGCLITKSVKYAHHLAHMVNAVRSGDPQPLHDLIELDLGIIPYVRFTLDDPCNLVLLEPFVHMSLDLFAFIALTPSSSTVNELIEMVKSDNDRRQQEMDRKGIERGRSLNFHHSSFTNPEYELLSLHPEHFLPRGAVLPIYDPATGTCRNYVPSRDRRLRESIEPDSARLPPFRHDFQNREGSYELNIFLVTLNAEIKFRRYLKMIQQQPPATALPDDVLALMRRVVELVDLLYWVPVPTEGSKGYAMQTQRAFMKRKNPERAGRSSQPQYTEITSDEEGGIKSLPTPTEVWKLAKRSRWIDWLAFPDVESRKAYGSALMSGHDIDYNPALFENAFLLDDPPRLYSDNAAMETWNQGVTSAGA
ncbi:hypothetical protein F5887DRAFT_1075330 [Amanita rubescens]|nr:hypothetical protein F5887DRAFT_1075330 [Amanita rubescens]